MPVGAPTTDQLVEHFHFVAVGALQSKGGCYPVSGHAYEPLARTRAGLARMLRGQHLGADLASTKRITGPLLENSHGAKPIPVGTIDRRLARSP